MVYRQLEQQPTVKLNPEVQCRPAEQQPLNRMTKGLSLRFARQLYLAVAVPRINYAADIWYTPPYRKEGAKKQSGKVGLTKKLDSIQRLAAIAITGAMSGVAGDAVALHADILPTRLMLLDSCLNAITRLTTHPPEHPLHPYVKRATRGPVLSHNTTLHTILNLADIDTNQMEVIPPTFLNPNFIPTLETTIHDSKELAIKWDNEHHADECMIYTDGSGYGGSIGASAVLYQEGVKKASLKYLLGSEKEHTVYEGELVGIILGLHLADTTNVDYDHINISLDNQPAIQAVHHRKPQPSQYLLHEIHKASLVTSDPNRNPRPTTLSLTWVPGHNGVEGNEAADELAKEAATGIYSPQHKLPPFLRNTLPTSKAATRQRLRKRIKIERRANWTESLRFNRLNKIDPSLPSKRFVKLTDELTRAQTSIITQLRTNHIALNANLYRIKRIDNPACTACNEADEDILHYLFVCPAYRSARLKIERALKRQSSNLETLLSDANGIPHLIRYVRETGRFKHLSKSLDVAQPTL